MHVFIRSISIAKCLLSISYDNYAVDKTSYLKNIIMKVDM